MTDARVTSITITTEADVVSARQAGREMARGLGFGMTDQVRLATAISELARNVLKYAGSGTCTIIDQSDDARCSLRVDVEDNGPGIPDIEQAMEDGFTTGGGLGTGLPGARRLVHEFSIESRPGFTKVMIAFMRPRDL